MPQIEPWTLRESAVERAAEKTHAALRAASPRALQVAIPADPKSPGRMGPLSDAVDAISRMLGRRAARVDQIANLCDPRTAPVETLPWLATWFGWDWLFFDPNDPRRTLDLADAFPPHPEHLRALLISWPRINRMRGRAEGLELLLRTATGLPDIQVDADPDRQQHLTIRAHALPPEWEQWFRRLIAHARPVHMTWEFQPKRQVAP